MPVRRGASMRRYTSSSNCGRRSRRWCGRAGRRQRV
jgi:hypothetical protein